MDVLDCLIVFHFKAGLGVFTFFFSPVRVRCFEVRFCSKGLFYFCVICFVLFECYLCYWWFLCYLDFGMFGGGNLCFWVLGVWSGLGG